MELTNEFRVSVPVDTAWAVLTDVERIAPCLPGAELQEVEDDEFRGVVKVKVGPITAQYKGAATFEEKDDTAHRAVLKAEGRDVRGQGNASATITATLTEDGDGTAVKVVTDLTVTGKVAQFGRGVLADVSSKLLTQFVDCLEQDLASEAVPAEGAGEDEDEQAPAAAEAEGDVDTTDAAEPAWAPAAPAPSASPTGEGGAPNASGSATNGSTNGPAGGPRRIQSKVAEPVDLLGTAGAPVAKRALPVVGGLLLVLWLLRRRRR